VEKLQVMNRHLPNDKEKEVSSDSESSTSSFTASDAGNKVQSDVERDLTPFPNPSMSLAPINTKPSVIPIGEALAISSRPR
jgi:hypothetical protein